MALIERETLRQFAMLQLQITVTTAAFLALLIFQTVTLINDRAALSNTLSAQENTVQQSLRARQQLDTIASGIAKLADEGDASARTIIGDLRRQGITVRNPQAPPAQ